MGFIEGKLATKAFAVAEIQRNLKKSAVQKTLQMELYL